MAELLGDGSQTISFDVVVPTEKGAVTYSTYADANIVDGVMAPEKSSTDEPLAPETVNMDVADPLTIAEVVETENHSLTLNGCGYNLAQWYKGRSVIVGSSFSTTNNVTTQFTFNKGSSSTVGIASSYGGWRQSGTTKVTTSWQDNVNAMKGVHGQLYKKTQDYARYRFQMCAGMQMLPDQVRPVGNSYETNASSAKTPTASRCANFYNSSGTTVDKGTATTHGAGVSIKSYIGIDLLAQSGYSTSIKVSFKKTSGSRFVLCGTNGVPQRDSKVGQIVAKP